MPTIDVYALILRTCKYMTLNDNNNNNKQQQQHKDLSVIIKICWNEESIQDYPVKSKLITWVPKSGETLSAVV